MWTTPLSEVMALTIANLRTALGGMVDHVLRIETAAEEALAHELDGLLFEDGGKGVVALVMKGQFYEREYGQVRSDVGDFPVTVFLCARREIDQDAAGEYRERQGTIAAMLDDLELQVDLALDVVSDDGPFTAQSYKVNYISRAGGPDQQASFIAGMALVRPVEFLFTVKRS